MLGRRVSVFTVFCVTVCSISANLLENSSGRILPHSSCAHTPIRKQSLFLYSSGLKLYPLSKYQEGAVVVLLFDS